MTEKWWFKSLLVPLLVSFLSALLSLFIAHITHRGKLISTYIEGPLAYYESTPNVSSGIVINGTPTNHLYGYKVYVWNSGSEPIEDVDILYRFETNDKKFTIFTLMHETNPKYLFGKITQLLKNNIEIKFEYELLNKGDEFQITLLSNAPYPLDIYIHEVGVKEIEKAFSKAQSIKKKYQLICSIPIAVFLFWSVLGTIKFVRGIKSDVPLMIMQKKYIQQQENEIEQQTTSEKEQLFKLYEDKLKKKDDE